MTDYIHPIVVQQIIPDSDMTPLERLLLSKIFTAARDGDGWYFFAEENPSVMITVARHGLDAAFAASPVDSTGTPHHGGVLCLI
jgi:hypothetical protein